MLFDFKYFVQVLRSLDFETLKEDTKFQIMLKQVDDYRAYKIGRYSIAKETIKYLVNLIEKELPHD